MLIFAAAAIISRFFAIAYVIFLRAYAALPPLQERHCYARHAAPLLITRSRYYVTLPRAAPIDLQYVQFM